MTELPKTIDNGHGEVLTFEALESTPEGERVRVSATVQPGAGPPLHTHFHQREHLKVEKGKLWVQIQGEAGRTLDPGESITFEAGQPHSFRAEGPEVTELSGWVNPPDNNIYFLSGIYDSARRKGKGGRPDDFDVAYLLGRFGGEYDMPEIPKGVKAVVFPALRLIGRLTGKFSRYSDAPPPLH